MSYRIALPIAVLLLPLVISCYTRLNHPMISVESRHFSPTPDSDCMSCHSQGELVHDWEYIGYADAPRRHDDNWNSFRDGAWWRDTSAPTQARTVTDAPAIVAPPAAFTPAPPAVMGMPTAPRRQEVVTTPPATSDSSQGDPPPERRTRRPKRLRPDTPLKPELPQPEDSLSKKNRGA